MTTASACLIASVCSANVVHAPSGTTKVVCCLYLLLTLLTMPGFVLCVLERHLSICVFCFYFVNHICIWLIYFLIASTELLYYSDNI